MKQKLTALSQRYVTALRRFLKPGAPASLQPALGLGHHAVTLGLETLELARIHEQALATLPSGRSQKLLRKRAQIFFSEANSLIEQTHRAARQSLVELRRLEANLVQRTAELAATQRQLERGVLSHKVMADTAERRGQQHDQCLAESLQLQKRLRQLTHRVLAAQEHERTHLSHELQDEVAQTLLGINARLLALQQAARNNTQGFKREIASTQRLVVKSARSVRRFARELGSGSGGRSFGSGVETLKPRRQLPVPRPHFPVIAMAASAGGLKALSVILGGLPADFRAAIAIVMHLSPEHKSILAEILNRRTHLAVQQAQTGDVLGPAKVFIAPPNHHLSVAKGGRLKLSSAQAEKINHSRPSAEPLFTSVAKVYQKEAIAVVLTGGDGDGSFGVQIIKDKGGLVIAQDRLTSQDFSMPETAIKTGDVDFILPLDAIAPKLIELVGAGSGQPRRRTNSQRTGPASTRAKLMRPHYSTASKAVMIGGRK